jgi:hypothetical protein
MTVTIPSKNRNGLPARLGVSKPGGFAMTDLRAINDWQACDAVERRSWAHLQEPPGEEWWADVLADPRFFKWSRSSFGVLGRNK